MINHGNKQAGGTLLGLIIGLVIGLSIAVGVAMTIKNTPLPFTNKLARQSKLPEPETGRIADPNKPIYGNKEAVRAVLKDAPKKTEEEKATEAAAQAQADEPRKPEPAPKMAKLDVKPAVAEKSLPERAEKALSEKTAVGQPAASPDEKYTYFLQAGAFLEQSDAENAKAKLALMGISANIAERKSDNGTLYRVRIGPFAQVESMNRVRGRLTDNGVDVAVVRVPK
jgi:cell division protein FtsN